MVEWSDLDPIERSAAMTLLWRAAESRRPDRLFADAAAERAAARLPPWPASPAGRTFADLVAVRTLQVDAEAAAALAGGPTQIVVLGAGFDTRFWRVRAPAGALIIGIDSAAINERARQLLPDGGIGARVDARIPGEVADALRGTAFDPRRATVWIAEGLLEYLPGREWDRLLDVVTAHSAEGSLALVTVLGHALPQRVAHDPTFPFRRLPPLDRIVSAVPGAWRVDVAAARPLRDVPEDVFAIMTMRRIDPART
jgi:methyltransferase (TIGR00027 family)